VQYILLSKTKKVNKKVVKTRKFYPRTMVYNRGTKRWIRPNNSYKTSSSVLRPATFGNHSVAAHSVAAQSVPMHSVAMNSNKPKHTNIRMGNLAAALPNLNNNNKQKNNNDNNL